MDKLEKRLKATPFIMLLVKDVNLLEHDARSQYKFNRFWAMIWSITMLAIPFIPTLYGHTISALIIQEVSLWANFATHFGAMSAALAAENTHNTVNEIDENVDAVTEVLGV